MWLYTFIYLIPICLFWHSYKNKDPQNLTQLTVYLFGLGLFVGLSDMFGGYDRYIYAEIFDSIADVTSYNGSYIANESFRFFSAEPGYTLLNIIISFFTENRYIFILVITLLTYSLLFVSIRRYADNYPFALILFIGLWFFFTFTYLRQVLGATVVWLSIPYIVKRKFWKFFLICLIAMSIHKSAILFAPAYFITTHAYKRKTVIMIMIGILFIGLSYIPNSIFEAYGDISSVEMQADYSSNNSLRIAYLIESIFFLLILLRKYKRKMLDPSHKVMFNLSLLFCATLLFFLRSENGGRLSWYYIIGLICTISSIATKKENLKYMTPALIIICFLLMIRIYGSWQAYMNLYPYKTFLSDGIRENDPVWAIYEYDHAYDNNKLYREPFRLRINILPTK